MCEYSLHELASRPAKVKDKLITIEFSSTHGFAAVGEHGAKLVIHDSPPKLAVCLLPGTELAFDEGRGDVVADLPQRGDESLGRGGAVIPSIEGSQAAFYACSCRCRDPGKLQQRPGRGDAAEEARAAEVEEEDPGPGWRLIGRLIEL